MHWYRIGKVATQALIPRFIACGNMHGSIIFDTCSIDSMK